MNNLAVDTLIDKRLKLLDEQYKMNEKYNAEIGELNKAINELMGAVGKEQPPDTLYDENSDYTMEF